MTALGSLNRNTTLDLPDVKGGLEIRDDISEKGKRVSFVIRVANRKQTLVWNVQHQWDIF